MKDATASLASIERESGMSSMQFAEKFADPKTAPVFDVGLKIILGAVKASLPGMTEDLLSERIKPGTFLPIVQQIAEKWGEAVAMAISEAGMPEASRLRAQRIASMAS